ncbi:MAG TPA: GNAT family N-acetyltransferase [Lactobacillus sp.]|nr:GNAT family N-acetyltransferase [Lactobacillus sp.]
MTPKILIKQTKDLTPQQLVRIMAARTRVFVVEQTCPYQEVDDKDLDAYHVLLEQNKQLVAYARIIPHDDGTSMSFGRVLVVKEFRKQHLGRQLVATTLATLARLYSTAPIKIQAQNYLRDFYGSFGFKAVSSVYLEDNIPHIDMVLDTTAHKNG